MSFLWFTLEEFGNYERNVGYLVENTKTVLQSQFHDLKTDVHIIPIEWHAKLHSMVDQRMALTSLRTVPKVRLVMNDYFADILYYFNNHYGSEIVRMIVDELNEAYSTFLTKHPDFNGKIAVYALSLGGVAMYDILTCLDDDESEEEQVAKDESATKTAEEPSSETLKDTMGDSTSPSTPQKVKKLRIRKQDQPKYRAVVPKLKFRPDILFTVGSPVGAVMVMRNLEWDTFHPPDDITHHNIFHPFDPLAYRIEPLIDPIFAAIPAVTLTSTGNSQLFPISLPSLLPSLPGSISSFWENKVPAIPRPSIPTLSTLSQMTQSIKTGRWLPGSSDRGSGSEMSIPTEVATSTDGTTLNESGGERFHEDQGSNINHTSKKHHHHKNVVDGNRLPDSELAARKSHKPHARSHVSVTEAIAAATVAAYLDQNEGGNNGTSNTSPMFDDDMSTTTTVPSKVPVITSRRPSLGPRRVSSRIQDEAQEYSSRPAAVSKAANSTSSSSISKVAEAEEGEGDPTSSTTQAAVDPTNITSEDLPPLHMEYYLGMEKGPTAVEKAQGEGAMSNVVQEDIVRSLLSSPVQDTHAHSIDAVMSSGGDQSIENMQAAHEEQEKAKQDGKSEGDLPKKGKKVTIARETETEERRGGKGDEKAKPEDTARTPIHVGGRETKVPYRVDHVLQETRVDQYTNEYLLGMRSHFRYWGNRDIAYHILKTILLPGGGADGGALDLQPEMPAPVTAPKNVKEAAKAKAKAAATAHRQSQDLGHRKSFSFSFTQSLRGQQKQQDSPPQDTDEDQYGASSISGSRAGYYGGYGHADEEELLYGYRYSDLDMSSAANVSFSTNTLYQNSPFAKSSSDNGGGAHRASSSRHGSGSCIAQRHMNRRRSSGGKSATGSSAEGLHSHGTGHGHGHGHEHGHTAGEDHGSSEMGPAARDSGSPLTAFDEGIVVPDLARPPRLHHRSSRVE
ncbi:hypothetical protein BGZ58_005586 [Dissophora ornata]|nr:hypothetical protein BGZ58_005586 [Dissophora ornata]